MSSAGVPAPRASDADRDRVTEQLRAAVADGRLNPDEFHERLDAALAARTLDALAPLTADLGSVPSSRAVLARSTDPAPARVIVKQRHGVVRRDGRWTLPRKLLVRTGWSGVLLDLTEAVRAEPELIIDLKVRGGKVELVLGSDMVLDANGLSAKFSAVEIERPAVDDMPKTLRVRLTGKIKHGHIAARWIRP